MRSRKIISLLSSAVCVASLFSPALAQNDSSSTDVIEIKAGDAQPQTVTSTTSTSTTTKTIGNSPAVSSQKRPKIGLALGGGGSRGAAHVGALKVLLEEGVPIDLIAGTSIGSVVGGFYSAGVSLDDIQSQFQNKTFIREFMPMPLIVRLALEPIIFIPRLVGYHPYDGLYKGTRFRKYADKLSGHTNIEGLNIPFAAVCTDVVSGKTCRITYGDLGMAMQASTAVPGLKKPVEIGEHLYCDGGLVCNLPIQHVREMGADFVIAINIDEYLTDVPISKFRKAGSMSQQALRIQLASEDDQSVYKADVSLHPDTTGITLISRKKSDAVHGIDAGIKAARDAMPEIRQKLLARGVVLSPPKPKVSSNPAGDSAK